MIQTTHASPYAGQWYPTDASQLRDLIAEVLAKSATRTGSFVRRNGVGFVVPHAAPVYSGTVAAAAYRHLQVCHPRRVVVLGFSHRHGVEGIGVPRVETISTPLGASEVDLEAATNLAGHSPFHLGPESLLCDHSVEIQLPFLQTVAPEAKVLPLYVGHLGDEERSAAANRLRWLANDGTVFVASSDLTHYGRQFGYLPFSVNSETGEHLKELDGGILREAASLEPELFLAELHRHRSTVCGSAPIALLLEILRSAPGDEIFAETLDYQTSGEITSDYAHSVSYGALGYFPCRAFELPVPAQTALLASARRAIVELSSTGARHPSDATGAPELSQRLGVFVTLYQAGELRGCIGQCRDPGPLAHAVPRLTLSAALDDVRFEPLRNDEPVMIEISILSPMKPVRDSSRLIAGEHGGYLEYGQHAGLLLPKVASERGWNTAQFLHALAHKAGLSTNIYAKEGARLSVFRAQVFGDR